MCNSRIYVLHLCQTPGYSCSTRCLKEKGLSVWHCGVSYGGMGAWRSIHRHTSFLTGPSCHERLQWLAKQILDAGGEATVSKVLVIEGLDDQEIQKRFNAQRNAEYVKLLKEASALRKRKEPPARLLRKFDRLKHLAKQVREIDYFGASKGRDLDDVLRQLEEELRGDSAERHCSALGGEALSQKSLDHSAQS